MTHKDPDSSRTAGNGIRKTTEVHKDLESLTYVAWTRFLRDADSWDSDQCDDYQLRELQRVVSHAYLHTRAYRRLFDAEGMLPNDIKSLEDVWRLPLVEREMLRDSLEDFSIALPERTYTTTGGSTGVPLGLFRDKDAFAKELASKAHQYYRIGWKEGDPQLVFRGIPIDTPDRIQFVPEFNELRCSSYFLTPDHMETFRLRACEYGPLWVRCYPSSGYIFARWLLETGRAFPAVRGVLCASENLYDFQKETIAKAFNARVFSHYGHYELAALAGYCEHTDDYHVLPQYGYVELIDSHGEPVTTPGAMGEIVATSFIMEATPLIRYRTRDFAVLKSWDCPACGRPYQIWERIEGRLQEFVVTGTGRYVSMTAINFHDDIFDHISQFQFVQEERGVLHFHYIPKPSCSDEVTADIHRRLMVKLGEDVTLTMKAVNDIPLTARGKHRFLIQKLNLAVGDK